MFCPSLRPYHNEPFNKTTQSQTYVSVHSTGRFSPNTGGSSTGATRLSGAEVQLKCLQPSPSGLPPKAGETAKEKGPPKSSELRIHGNVQKLRNIHFLAKLVN